VLLAPESESSEAARSVVQEIEAGALFFAYFGHGSVTQLGRERYLSVDDVTALETTQLAPVMLHFTCLTGLFTHPTVESLTETLLWLPEGGPVAVMAPTSLTLPTNQRALMQGILEGYRANPDGTLGDIMLAAWTQVPLDSPDARDVARTFLLFGDPALRLQRAEQGTES
jgi:hypothetical protein